MSGEALSNALAILDELREHLLKVGVPLDAPQAGPWGTWGPGLGDCGHQHRTFSAAQRCAYTANMRRLRASQGRYHGDRRPYKKGTDPRALYARFKRQST